METKHAPIPWVAVRENYLDYIGHGIFDANDKQIAETCCADPAEVTEEEQSNAAFIIRAVNNHDALVETLEMAYHLIMVHHTKGYGKKEQTENALRLISERLTEAKGE